MSPIPVVQLRGHKVSIVEKRRVEGRMQEWNVSLEELQVDLFCALVNMFIRSMDVNPAPSDS